MSIINHSQRNSIISAASAFREDRRATDLSAKEVMQIADINFDAVKLENYYYFNKELRKGNDFQVVRNDTGRSLGVVGKNYTCIPNADVFEPAHVTAQTNDAILEAGGNINGGETCFTSYKLPFDIALNDRPDDIIGSNMLIFNNFSGKSHAVMMIFTTRFFCLNQVRALRMHGKKLEGSAFIHKIRHNSKSEQRLKTAHDAFAAAIAGARATKEFADALNAIPMTSKQMVNFAEKVLPNKIDENGDERETSTRLENQRAELIDLFAHGAGNLGKTRWDAFNAVTEFVNHTRGAKTTSTKTAGQNRMASVLIPGGQGDKMVIAAGELLLAR